MRILKYISFPLYHKITFCLIWFFLSVKVDRWVWIVILSFYTIPCNYAQSLEIDPSSIVVPNPGIPVYPGFPDGHITYFPLNDSTYVHIWAGYESYISSGSSWMHQDSLWGMVLSKGIAGSYDNGGAWLYAVFPMDSLHWVGFYHAEDHEFSGYENSMKIAWKSAAQCESFDGGKTWIKNGQILTSWLDKPNAPEWGGTGDFSVVRDSINNRWLAFYVCPNGIGVAQSKDAFGKPGTWNKYNNGKFSSPGLNGKGDPLPFSKGKYAGGNPSLIYYSPLKTWFLVYHDWNDKGIYYTSSSDLETWSKAILLVKNPGAPQRVWYPTLLSAYSDAHCENELYLAYAQWDDINLPYRNYRISRVHVHGLTPPELNSSAWFTESQLLLTDTTTITLTLNDALGKTVYTFYNNTQVAPGTHYIDLEPWLAKGINYLVLTSNQKFEVKKLIRW